MEQPLTLAEAETEIIEEFDLFDEPREAIEHIVELGRELAPMDEALKTDGALVRGCQSRVWLVAELDAESGRMHLKADSDAVIVKGLIVLVLRLFDRRAANEIAATETQVFERGSASASCSPGRQNGLYSMLTRIRQLAAAYATAGNAGSGPG
ncbi:MAG: SufE family protein [Geminicoccaceae bacterium]